MRLVRNSQWDYLIERQPWNHSRSWQRERLAPPRYTAHDVKMGIVSVLVRYRAPFRIALGGTEIRDHDSDLGPVRSSARPCARIARVGQLVARPTSGATPRASAKDA